ncbi:hypothetical protein FOZ60_011797 [Perkinsus olseni]|uniref:N-acetyltransferase domain-containing protein n=1 Tax=Perkinsus olseni TaxID=32597 RepID=A0A7J6PLY8_PEROL|nr:hypothetical protein FOZ60_011797 [Perkinsus olseni]
MSMITDCYRVEASTKFNSANLGASEDLEKFLGSLKPKKPSAKYAAASGSALEEKLNDGIASKLEYRHWKPGDMMFEEEMQELPDVRTFVAVDPSADHGVAVVAYVESRAKRICPSYIRAQIPGMTANDTVVYISSVFVDPDLHNRRIGSTMLPKALKDIRVNWPTVIAAYLDVDPRNAVAARLYYRHNFTYVTGLRSPPEGSLLKGEAHADTLINLEPDKTGHDSIVYISNVFVDPDLRNKRIASTMLPKALKDIRVKWPKVIAAYLIVEIEKEFAVKLYYGLNFTVVAVRSRCLIMIYKYPPRIVSE